MPPGMRWQERSSPPRRNCASWIAVPMAAIEKLQNAHPSAPVPLHGGTAVLGPPWISMWAMKPTNATRTPSCPMSD